MPWKSVSFYVHTAGKCDFCFFFCPNATFIRLTSLNDTILIFSLHKPNLICHFYMQYQIGYVSSCFQASAVGLGDKSILLINNNKILFLKNLDLFFFTNALGVSIVQTECCQPFCLTSVLTASNYFDFEFSSVHRKNDWGGKNV